MNDTVLTARALTRWFTLDGERLDVLRGVDLDAAPGSITGIVGESGTGKSTLLHILGGLDRPGGGKLTLGGEDFYRQSDDRRAELRGRLVGFVFQFHHLLPEFSALENALMPAMIARADMADARLRARDLFERVGMAHRLNHRPGKLSGGEQQRTALVRALINRPRVLLADEPTGNLDENTSDEVFELLREVAREQDLATIIVTHNPALAKRMDGVYELTEGRLQVKEV